MIIWRKESWSIMDVFEDEHSDFLPVSLALQLQISIENFGENQN